MMFLFFGGKIFSYPYWFVKKYFLGCNYKTYEEARNNLNNPLDIQCFMFTQFEYISDKSYLDEWQPPERTWDRKGGDCEDWALFAQACMKANQDDVFILSFYPKSRVGHATCVVVEKKDTYITMGTFGLRRIRGELKDIPEKWYKDWKYMFIHKKDGSRVRVDRT